MRDDGSVTRVQGAEGTKLDFRYTPPKADSLRKEYLPCQCGEALVGLSRYPRGVFILCERQVRLSISSADGKTLILRIAKAGEVLGLTSALARTSYEVTAATLRPC